jgi:hypothetical protein
MMRSIELIHGVLRGMGFETDCEMVAIKDAHPDDGKPVYTRWSVIEAPSCLPDGNYTVSFNNCSVAVRREGGLWLADDPSLSGAA